MTKYDSQYHHPPAPLARVLLVNPDTGVEISDIPMLIDSGADVTLLPVMAIRQLALQVIADKAYEVEGFDGTRSVKPVVRAILKLDKFTFKGQYFYDDREIGVLGRNILNNLILELDGARLDWSVR